MTTVMSCDALLVTLHVHCFSMAGITPPPPGNVISGQLWQFWATFLFRIFIYLFIFSPKKFFTSKNVFSLSKMFFTPNFSSMSCGWSKAQHNATKHSSFFSDVSSNENKISFLHVSGAAVGRGRQIWQIVWIFVALLSYETTSHVIKQDSNKPGCHWVQDRLIFYDSGSTLFWPKHHCLLLLQVGISVSSGALTACSSACWLLGAKIIFFQQFGIFMVTTLGFSLLWALGFFTTACGVFGPQGDFGCITKIIKSIFCKSKKNDNA